MNAVCGSSRGILSAWLSVAGGVSVDEAEGGIVVGVSAGRNAGADID